MYEEGENRMSEEMVVRYKCDRCPFVQESTAKKGLVGYKSGGYPSGWKNIHGKNLCPSCVREFNMMFAEFMRNAPKKEGKK